MNCFMSYVSMKCSSLSHAISMRKQLHLSILIEITFQLYTVQHVNGAAPAVYGVSEFVKRAEYPATRCRCRAANVLKNSLHRSKLRNIPRNASGRSVADHTATTLPCYAPPCDVEQSCKRRRNAVQRRVTEQSCTTL